MLIAESSSDAVQIAAMLFAFLGSVLGVVTSSAEELPDGGEFRAIAGEAHMDITIVQATPSLDIQVFQRAEQLSKAVDRVLHRFEVLAGLLIPLHKLEDCFCRQVFQCFGLDDRHLRVHAFSPHILFA